MTNTKAQMTNEVQNPNDKGEQVWPSGIWSSIVIGILKFGLIHNSPNPSYLKRGSAGIAANRKGGDSKSRPLQNHPSSPSGRGLR
jgi:hypothetical protein